VVHVGAAFHGLYPNQNSSLTDPIVEVQGEWRVPASWTGQAGDYNTPYDQLMWVGLGDALTGYGGTMWQGGTHLHTVLYSRGRLSTVTFWHELLLDRCATQGIKSACIAEQTLAVQSPWPGDDVSFDLWLSSDPFCGTRGVTQNDGTQRLGYIAWDYTQNVSYYFCLSVSGYLAAFGATGPANITAGSVEWIVESPTFTDGVHHFPQTNPTTVTMYNASAYDPFNGWQYYVNRWGLSSYQPDEYHILRPQTGDVLETVNLFESNPATHIDFNWLGYW